MVTARSKTKPEITGEIQVLVTKKTSSNPAGAFTYEINSDNKGVTITGYRGKNPERLVIPGEIEGKPVTKIGKEAFKYGAFGSGKIETAITSLELPDTLEEIDNNAFRGNKFASLVFPKSLKIIGEAAFESNNYIYETVLDRAKYSDKKYEEDYLKKIIIWKNLQFSNQILVIIKLML